MTIPLPEQTEQCIGHEAQEAQVAALARAGRMPHAWLFTGVEGVGKCTTAMRLTRWLLAGMPKPEADTVDMFGGGEAEDSITIPESHPVFRKLAQGGHPDCLVIRADPEKASGEIAVEDIRAVSEWAHKTAAESDWRIVIVDPAEAMNRNAANALLKLLEEPPHHMVMFLISHHPGRLLPTLRSRCRSLAFQPLSDEQVEKIAAPYLSAFSPEQQDQLLRLAEGSPGIASRFGQSNILQKLDELLEALTHDTRAARAEVYGLSHEWGQSKDREVWQMSRLLMERVMVGAIRHASGVPMLRLDGSSAEKAERKLYEAISTRYSVDQLLDMWENAHALFRDTEGLYLDKSLVIQQWMEEWRAA